VDKLDDPRTYEEALSILAGLASLASATSTVPGSASTGSRLDVDYDQARLHLAEARYRALVEQVPAVTFIASLVGGISEIYVSPQIEALLGFTQEQWVSDPVLWFRQLHAEDRPVLTREFAEACATGSPLRGMCRAYTRDGRMVWVHGEARFVRDEQGRPIFLQGIAFDVTEQQKAVEMRQALLQEQARRVDADRDRARIERTFAGLPAAVMILRGPDHRIEFFNHLAGELGGVTDKVLGKSYADAVPQHAAELGPVFDQVYATGRPFEAKEWETTSPHWPGQRYFDYVAQPLFEDDARISGILIHTVEVTQQVNARKDRERAVEELQRTLRFNETFSGMLGHDLRNPLGAILTGAQLALRRSPGEGLVKPLQRIVSAGERMSRMIDQLLDFTRIRVGRGIALQPAQVSMVELCRRVLDELEDSNSEWNMKLSVVGDPNGRWDDDRLLQVISNLVSNGLKHGDPSAPLDVSVDGSDAASVTLRVHNRGRIPTELMSSLFDPFRGTQHRRDRARGLGLGLFITKQIVLAHCGNVDVESDDAGTRFIVTLPRIVPQGDAPRTLAP
jgi:PAS domain S-box-containing protein